AAFVTTFTWRLEHEGEAAAWRLANLVVNALAIVVGTITLAGIWLAPALVTAIAPGFADIPGKVELTVTLTRIMFPFLLLGTLAGGLLQLLVQVPSLWRVGFRYRPLLALRDPGLRQVARLMAPATIGAAAVQVNVFVNNNFASYLGNGPVSWLNVAFRFMQL